MPSSSISKGGQLAPAALFLLTVQTARTSTTYQKAGLEAQLRDLTQAGCTKIFREELSSVASIRSELEKALEWVREGDMLVVTKLDGLARSTADLVTITKALAEKKVELTVLALNLDTDGQAHVEPAGVNQRVRAGANA